MSRAERLLQLMQALRGRRHPVRGAVLAQDLGISLRTLYRDIGALQAQGAHIDGAPGLGYVLRPGFTLPPLMFSHEEIEALVLGTRWVASRADTDLGRAARNALDKIASVVPMDLRLELDSAALLVGPGEFLACGDRELSCMREAIRTEHKLRISYRDLRDQESSRTIWPCALGYFDRVRVLVAWCELRQDFRHFRADRITAVEPQGERYPHRRQALLQQWRQQQGVEP